jgi:hypothetical protein
MSILIGAETGFATAHEMLADVRLESLVDMASLIFDARLESWPAQRHTVIA